MVQVTGDATPDGIRVVRSVPGAISSLPVVAFREEQFCVAKRSCLYRVYVYEEAHDSRDKAEMPLPPSKCLWIIIVQSVAHSMQSAVQRSLQLVAHSV